MNQKEIDTLTSDQKNNILKELTEWMYIQYGDEEFFMCPLCENTVELPSFDPQFNHLRNCPFYKEVTHEVR